jgi:hypothetical protein
VTEGDAPGSNDAGLEQTGEEDSFLRKVAAVTAGDLPRAAEPDLAGRTLGSIVLRRKLGAGGMGVVYLAEDRKLRRTVAVKVLPVSLAADPERTRRFLREARAASAVLHPNIAAVFGAGEEDGIVFLVIELVAGKTLRAILEEQGGPLAISEALRLTRAITAGLSAAHEAGIIHRDLKPENVMVTGEGQVKILDFGLAKVIPSGPAAGLADMMTATELVTVEGRIMGTPSYMPPEQAKGGVVDARSDIFALGVMLFEMVTGARPFRGSSIIEIIIATDRDTPPPASSLRPGAPRALDAVIARCLEKRPADRFASCRELAAALDAAGEETPRAPLFRWARGRPKTPAHRRAPSGWRVAAAGALAATLSAAALARLVGGSGSDPQRAAEAPRRSLADPAEVLACPPLALAADEPPHHAWLGGAAAAAACNHAMLMLGGRLERVLMPAALLDLPRVPTSSFPIDPYNDAGARDRALSAARARGSFILDGEVDAETSGVRVALVLRDPGGAALASREARGKDVRSVVYKALEAFADAGELPMVAAVDPSVADWHGTTSTRELLAWQRFSETVTPTPTLCAEPSSLPDRFGSLAPLVRIECKLEELLPAFEREHVPPLPVDTSRPGALAITARYHVVSGGQSDKLDLIRRIHEARMREKEPLGRALLAHAEAEFVAAGGAPSRAREIALVAVDAAPSLLLAWRGLASSSVGFDGFPVTARAFAAWRPDYPTAWSLRAQFPGGSGEELGGELSQLELSRRAYTLAPEEGALAQRFGELLLQSGEREEPRVIAARLLALPAVQREERIAGEALMILLEVAQARFQAAFEHARQVLEAHESLGGPSLQHLTYKTILLAAVLDRRTALADLLIQRFVDVEPTKLTPFGHTPMIALWACAHASPAPSRRCIRRVRELVGRSYFTGLVRGFGEALHGAERFARGDRAGAAEAWRPILKERRARAMHDALAIAFDEAGEGEIAERIDEDLMKQAALWGGATLAHARAARRAARGDKAQARKLAEQVVAAWLAADAPVPAVAEMRALLRRL